jgi:hypothetical protein
MLEMLLDTHAFSEMNVGDGTNRVFLEGKEKKRSKNCDAQISGEWR